MNTELRTEVKTLAELETRRKALMKEMDRAYVRENVQKFVNEIQPLWEKAQKKNWECYRGGARTMRVHIGQSGIYVELLQLKSGEYQFYADITFAADYPPVPLAWPGNLGYYSMTVKSKKALTEDEAKVWAMKCLYAKLAKIKINLNKRLESYSQS